MALVNEPDALQRFDCDTESDQALAAAAAAVTAGRCIVLPTDTVYGIGANAFDPAAVQGLLDAKQRGRDMPPPVLIAEPSMLRSLATGLTADGLALAKAFWPGALTVVVTAHPDLRLDLGDRGATLAVRVPDHAFTRALLRHTGPLAVSSANVSGRPAATTIDEAIEQLGDEVAVYLDAGPAGAPVPSTIVDLTGEPRILREGRLTREQLEAAVPGLFGDDA
ncbi:L-threonylcarbamoyladenylate synthase [Micropruina sp.]|uniref:L-threonylcarbamoyladenylate synthase n=1 Tax=Micropruina sp. TaxID=2737536 RepID=UPI0039E4A5B2